MLTYEMVKLADENGKTYFTSDMAYNKEKGFFDRHDGSEWDAYAFDNFIGDNGLKGLDYFVHIDSWEEVLPKKMTKTDIEKLLGYKIELIEE